MYKINKKGSEFIIIEISTGSVLKRAKTYDEIKAFYNLLKKGYGFVGHTPNFILNEKDRNLYKDI